MSEPVSGDALRPNAEFLSSVEQKIAARRNQLAAAGPRIAPAPAQPAPEELKDGYELAAAVLAWFEPGELRPLANAPRQGNVADLEKQCVFSADESGQKRFALSSTRRIEALKWLREKGLVPAALAANTRSQDPVQLTLDGYLTGTARKIEDQTLAELASTHQVCDWLRSAGFTSIPALPAIVQRVEWLSLLNPFEHVASDERFRGRKNELEELRVYAGVVPPTTRLQIFRRVAENILDLKVKPPLLIVGVGGVGKSTLVSRFILEHARALEIHRFPFAYLDFDRPEVDPSQPLTLLIEAVRQLGIEYPQARMQCDSLGRAWTEAASDSRRATAAQSKSLQTATSANRALAIAIGDFAAMVTTLGAKDSPVLFVLDTFEEVQWRSAGSVDAIWNMLEMLQESMPRLRVVFAGRADIPGKRTQTLALTGLDPESAVAYLQARGIKDERVAKRVAQQIGGSPLSLQLAAELYRQEGANKEGDLELNSRTSFFFKVDSSIVQRQLYARVLNHIHDPNVRKLAHPGLIVRRITPDLILKVLAEPCDIQIHTEEDAQRLFNALKREVALVSEAPDGSLQHRRDLRLVMIELLRQSVPKRVAAIHQGAVAYYESQSTNAVERAEEIYHRLSLDQDPDRIADRWMQGVEPYLASAMEEFTGRRRAWLASRLGLDVDEATRQLARLEDWETIAIRDAERLLAHGDLDAALAVIRARADRPAVGPLVGLEARALIQMGKVEEALDVIERGFAAAVDASNHEFALSLAVEAADIVLVSGSRQVKATMDHLSLMQEGTLPPAAEIAILARCVALAGADQDLQARKDGDLEKLRKVFDEYPDDGLRDSPSLGYWAAAVFERDDVQRMARVISMCGLPRGLDAELRSLGSNLTFLDVVVSRQAGEPEGMLARKLGIPIQSSLTVAWGDYLLRAPDEVLRKQLPGLLVEYADHDGIVSCIVGATLVMRAAIGIRGFAQPQNVRPNERPKGTPAPASRADKTRLTRIVTAIQKSFKADDFADFVHYRLNRSIDAFSISDNPAVRLSDITKAAEAQGWLGDLVSQLVNANPDDLEIGAIAQEMGLLSHERLLDDIVSKSAKLDPSAFRSLIRESVPRVAQVAVNDRVLASGFLVGPDLLLTSDYALSDVYSGAASSNDVSVAFTSGVDAAEAVLERFPLEKDWLVARSQMLGTSGLEGLGYALIRVAQSPGVQPLGGSRAEASARLRQWFEMTGEHHSANVEDWMIVIGWSPESGNAPRLELGRFQGQTIDGFIQYIVEAAPSFAGAPCFSQDLHLLGMHLGKGGENCVAVSIDAIRADFSRKHLGGAAEMVFA